MAWLYWCFYRFVVLVLMLITCSQAVLTSQVYIHRINSDWLISVTVREKCQYIQSITIFHIYLFSWVMAGTFIFTVIYHISGKTGTRNTRMQPFKRRKIFFLNCLLQYSKSWHQCLLKVSLGAKFVNLETFTDFSNS